VAKIVVVGSINADLVARVSRNPKPGETLIGRDLVTLPGGKGANQAVAAALLSESAQDVALIGAVGSDEFAISATAHLAEIGLDLTGVRAVPGPTGIALISVGDDGENAIVVIPGANLAVTAAEIAKQVDRIATATVVVVQCEISPDAIATVARATSGRLLLNLAPVIALDPEVIRLANPLVVNEHEAIGALECLSGVQPQVTSYVDLARRLLDAGVPSVVMTLGSAGAMVGDSHAIGPIPAPKVKAVDTTGAGDAFVGALACRLADGDTLIDATRYAVRVGAYAVTGEGAQPSYPTRDDELPEEP